MNVHHFLFIIGKDRPRPTNRKAPVKRGTNGNSNDSSSDGGLDNDDNSLGDVPPTSTIETAAVTETQTNEPPSK